MIYGKLVINGEFRDNGFTVEYNIVYILIMIYKKEAVFEYLKSLYSVLNATLVKDIEFFEIKSNFELTYAGHKMIVHDKKLFLRII